MKKLALTLAIVLGLVMASFADNGGGLFGRGEAVSESNGYAYEGNGSLFPQFPNHMETSNQPAPLGSGIAVLMGLGAAYMVAKKRKED